MKKYSLKKTFINEALAGPLAGLSDEEIESATDLDKIKNKDDVDPEVGKDVDTAFANLGKDKAKPHGDPKAQAHYGVDEGLERDKVDPEIDKDVDDAFANLGKDKVKPHGDPKAQAHYGVDESASLEECGCDGGGMVDADVEPIGDTALPGAEPAVVEPTMAAEPAVVVIKLEDEPAGEEEEHELGMGRVGAPGGPGFDQPGALQEEVSVTRWQKLAGLPINENFDPGFPQNGEEEEEPGSEPLDPADFPGHKPSAGKVLRSEESMEGATGGPSKEGGLYLTAKDEDPDDEWSREQEDEYLGSLEAEDDWSPDVLDDLYDGDDEDLRFDLEDELGGSNDMFANDWKGMMQEGKITVKELREAIRRIVKKTLAEKKK